MNLFALDLGQYQFALAYYSEIKSSMEVQLFGKCAFYLGKS